LLLYIGYAKAVVRQRRDQRGPLGKLVQFVQQSVP
jgi:hypothetical protein